VYLFGDIMCVVGRAYSNSFDIPDELLRTFLRATDSHKGPTAPEISSDTMPGDKYF
jgi:hypothetical protein